MKECVVLLLYILSLCYCNLTHVVLKLESDFTDWLPFDLVKQNCAYGVVCEIINETRSDVIGNIYNSCVDRYKSHYSNVINIDANLEPQRRWPRTYNISEGKDKHFQFAITYRLYYTKHNFAMSYLKTRDVDDLINAAKSSLKNNPFENRKNEAVAVFGVKYKNRNKLIKMISEYMKVDLYGKAFNHFYNGSKLELLRHYKFCIAIENSIEDVKFGEMHSCKEDDYYVTEKLLECLRAGSIPIYFGPRNARLYFPNGKSVIFSGDFENYKEMMKYIVSIKENEKELNDYIYWPNAYYKEWYNRFEVDYLYSSCRLCEYVKYFYMEKDHDEDKIKFDKNDNIIKVN